MPLEGCVDGWAACRKQFSHIAYRMMSDIHATGFFPLLFRHFKVFTEQLALGADDSHALAVVRMEWFSFEFSECV